MNLFEAARLQDVLDELRSVSCSSELLAENPLTGDDPTDQKFTKRAYFAVQNAITICDIHHFADAKEIASRARVELSNPREYPAIRSEVRHVADAICDELRKRHFVMVSPTLAQYVENPAWIGKEVENTFQDALNDIYEAGNCLGTECSTAAVFHLMRVVEWGLRYLCAHLGLKKARSRKGKPVPISYADWEAMLNQLQQLVDAKIGRMRRGPAKQAAQEFYYPALQDIRAIRDAWRNHLMHTRAVYSAADAEAIASHVKRLMSALAKRKIR